MRFIVIKQDSSLQSLAAQLVRDDAPQEAALERLQRLNPHVDLNRLDRNTVLLLPESPGFRSEGERVGADGFALLSREVNAALAAGTRRAKDALAQAGSNRKELAKVLRSAAVRRLADEDGELAKRLASATAGGDDDGDEVASRLDALQKGAAAELKKLKTLLG